MEGAPSARPCASPACPLCPSDISPVNGGKPNGSKGTGVPSSGLLVGAGVMRPHPSTCATIPQWPGCRSALRLTYPQLRVLTYPQLLAGTVADRVGTGGFETCPCRGPVSSLPQTGVSLFGCRYPCEKERLPLTRRLLLGAVPNRTILPMIRRRIGTMRHRLVAVALGCYCGTCML